MTRTCRALIRKVRPLPANRTLTSQRARLASAANWHPGSPEHKATLRTGTGTISPAGASWRKVGEILGKAPPLSEAQRETIVDLLRSAGDGAQ